MYFASFNSFAQWVISACASATVCWILFATFLLVSSLAESLFYKEYNQQSGGFFLVKRESQWTGKGKKDRLIAGWQWLKQVIVNNRKYEAGFSGLCKCFILISVKWSLYNRRYFSLLNRRGTKESTSVARISCSTLSSSLTLLTWRGWKTPKTKRSVHLRSGASNIYFPSLFPLDWALTE